MFELVSEEEFLKKKATSNKFCCVAASPFNTIISAHAAYVENKSEVYLLDYDINGVKKTIAYKRCCKSIRPTEKSDILEISDEKSKDCEEDNSLKLCHRHQNAKSLKIFDIDILPKGRLATEDDPYFKSMGIRGAKKKNGNNIYVFDSSKNPILEILNHHNRNYYTSLMIEALKIQKKISTKKDISNLVSLLNNETKSTQKHQDESDKDESDEDESDEQEIDLYKDNTENISLLSEDEEEVSCEAIFTTNGDQLWYNPSDNHVYEPTDEDDNGKSLGILKEISSKYETIQYNNKSYTVMIDLDNEEKGEIHCCVLSNKLFKLNDKDNFKLIGKRILIKSSAKSADKKYKLVFNE
jgi:hypothetical protein